MPSQPRDEDTQTSITYPKTLVDKLDALLVELKLRRLIHQTTTRNGLVLQLVEERADEVLRGIGENLPGKQPER